MILVYGIILTFLVILECMAITKKWMKLDPAFIALIGSATFGIGVYIILAFLV
jgi:hypothetical protein